MPFHPQLLQAALTASVLLASLAACRQQTPPEPISTEPGTQVKAISDSQPGASDHPDAPPAIGALTAGQASGGARSGPAQPTAGDGASGPASAASR